jgi:hypothetical protein
MDRLYIVISFKLYLPQENAQPISILRVVLRAFLSGKVFGHIITSTILRIVHLGDGVRNTVAILGELSWTYGM